jgi:hypothetical protein
VSVNNFIVLSKHNSLFIILDKNFKNGMLSLVMRSVYVLFLTNFRNYRTDQFLYWVLEARSLEKNYQSVKPVAYN